MKNTLLIILLFIINNSYSQNSFIDFPKTSKTDLWNGSNWDGVSLVTYTFNNRCLVTEGLFEAYKDVGGNTLENTSFFTISYNANDLPKESISQLWNENTDTWQNDLKTNFTYTGTNLTKSISSLWINNNWQITGRILIMYDTLNALETVYQDWDISNMIWINTTKIEYTYNTNNSYDIVTDFNWISNNWVIDDRTVYSYSGTLNTVKKREEWNGSLWQNKYLENYTYDDNDFLIKTLRTDWNGSTYENNSQEFRTNNSQGKPTETILQTWIFGSWLRTIRETSTYPSCSTLSVENTFNKAFKIYPNPAKNEVNINSSISGAVSIMDLNGRTLISEAIKNNKNTIDTSLLNNGVYLLIFQSENRKEAKRLVIEK